MKYQLSHWWHIVYLLIKIIYIFSVNQSNANVSVVRLGQSEPGANNGDITLTVDPPTFTSSNITPIGNATSTDATGLVDPFMEMDPEQLERLETALQSEEAKQILGENVTAMLGTLMFNGM